MLELDQDINQASSFLNEEATDEKPYDFGKEPKSGIAPVE